MKHKYIQGLILSMSSDPFLSKSDSFVLNRLILNASMPIIRKQGKPYAVKSSRKHKNITHKLGCCYGNAARKMVDKGLYYVEGYIKHKISGIKICHAWNAISENEHIDFTLNDAENYNYFGIILPQDIVYKVGMENGHIWYVVLPFVKYVAEEYKTLGNLYNTNL
jgi:hypothetical protein